MPEGDTILATARRLTEALAGREVVGFDSSLAAVAATAQRVRLVGRRVLGAEARGKHLLLRFEGGLALHTHLRMQGRWVLQRSREGRRPSAAARAVIGTREWTAVCLRAPVVELLDAAAERRHGALLSLGPDVLSPGFDTWAAVERLRQRPGLEIGVALLDQAALAGIGNVYKSEVLFLCGVHPLRRVAGIDDATLLRLVETARRQMSRNLGPGMRRTTTSLAPARHWVYRCAHRPCQRCGSLVERRVQGAPPRATFFCPTCQPWPEGVATP